MSDRPIPDEVMRAAREAVEAMPKRLPFKSDVETAIARAIMAERRARDERAAGIIEARCEFILSRQDGKDGAIDSNLRMMACILPDLAAAIRGEG